jgi:RNA polymerase sigma factor (sigma-70 family)
MQELFVRLNSSRAFNKAENPPAYAHKAAANLALDWRRKQAREPRSLAYVREPGSNDNSPLSNLAQKEQLEETLNAISQLGEPYRQTLVMRYIQQNSYEEIAQVLGRDAHHVRVLCSRAISRLRKSLASDKAQSPRKGVSND